MDVLSVPPNLAVPDGATADYARQVRRVNAFLEEARLKLAAMQREVARLGKISGDIAIHNGPNGIIIGSAE